MKKRKSSIAFFLGACLILVSLFLVVALQIRVRMGSDECQSIIAKMQELLPDRSAGVPGAYPNSWMPILEIDGVDYVAMIEVPAFDVTLPVADQWNRNKLFDSPARFCGSAYDNTLVIGGVDDSHQFAFCDKIENGAAVTVTDMTGTQFAYTVVRVDRAKNAQNQWLTDADFDLTFFCRDIYSMEYIAVRCDFAYG